MSKGDSNDPKGLILDAYRIEGIAAPECRSIFLDWALSLPEGTEPPAALRALLDRYATDHPDHPMTAILQEGLRGMARPARRGGWRGRARN